RRDLPGSRVAAGPLRNSRGEGRLPVRGIQGSGIDAESHADVRHGVTRWDGQSDCRGKLGHSAGGHDRLVDVVDDYPTANRGYADQWTKLSRPAATGAGS